MASFEDDYDEDFNEDGDEFLKDIVALPNPKFTANFLSEESFKAFSESSETISGKSNNDKHMPPIVVDTISFSSDPLLTDTCRDHQLSHIHQEWHINGHKGFIVQQLVHKLYSSSRNPYLSAAYAMYHSYDFLKNNKPNSLASFVMDQFEIWLEEFHKLNGYHLVAEEKTTLDAITAVSKQKNGKLLKKVIKLYQGVKLKLQLIGVVQNLISQKDYLSACHMAVALELYNQQFKKEDFVLPLIVQDKLSPAEEYLRKDKAMQKEVVSFMDQYVKNPRDMLDKISQSYIPGVNHEKLNSKNIANLVLRLAKRFDLNKECHPQTNLRQTIGGLRYLVHKKYIEKTLDSENWEELVEVAVSCSQELQVELINLLSQCLDDEGAVKWARRFQIPLDKLPEHLVPIMESNSSTQLDCVLNHALDLNFDIDPKVKAFYPLNLSVEKIQFIDSWKDLQACLSVLSQATTVGIDVEWQPTFGSQTARAAVLQIATHESIFLVDIFSLREIEKISLDQSRQLIKQVFDNPHLLKLGFGMKEDLQVLSRSFPGLHDISKSIKNFLDLRILWSTVQSRYPSLLPSAQGSKEDFAKGLSGVIQLLYGLPLDKKEQFSDWEKRPLRQSQVYYAALDAFCLLEVHDTIYQQSCKLGIDWLDVIKDQSTCHTPCDLNFVCDTMLHRLGKLMRSCGIDTVFARIDNPSPDECVYYALREKRYVLSRGTMVQKLRKHVGPTYCIEIFSDRPNEQILEVVKHFNIRVREEDIFSRCQVCNSNKFHRLDRKQFSRVHSECTSVTERFHKKMESKTDPEPGKSWILIEAPPEMSQNKKTSRGTRIKTEDVPEGVIAAQDIFYICIECGKCYWEGSHLGKVLNGCLKEVLEWSAIHQNEKRS